MDGVQVKSSAYALFQRFRATAVPESQGLRFLALALWISVLGVFWLEPASRQRRALESRAVRLQAEVRGEWLLNSRLERLAAGLQNDPTMIEREARSLGYGRPGEMEYPLSDAELRAFRARTDEAPSPERFAWSAALARSMAPALMLLIAAVVAVLFFVDLKVEDGLGEKAHAEAGDPDEASHAPPTG